MESAEDIYILIKEEIAIEILRYFKTMFFDFRDQNPTSKNILNRFQNHLNTRIFPETFSNDIDNYLSLISSKINGETKKKFTELVYKEASKKIYYRVDLIDDRNVTFLDTMKNNDQLIIKIDEAIKIGIVRWKRYLETYEYSSNKYNIDDDEKDEVMSTVSDIPETKRKWKHF